MNDSDKNTKTSSAVSLLIHHEVQEDAHKTYEVWLKKVIDIASSFAGHEGVLSSSLISIKTAMK